MNKRNRYDYKFKLQCVETVLKKGQSIGAVANAKGFDKSNLKLWVLFYKKYGKEGLKPRIQQRYEPSFKLQVLTSINKEFLSLRAACVKFNISGASVIKNWQKAYELHGKSGLILKPKQQSPKIKPLINMKTKKSKKPLTKEEELLRENQYLKIENELLKKLHALVQAEKKRKP